jgi:hypothetical protein
VVWQGCRVRVTRWLTLLESGGTRMGDPNSEVHAAEVLSLAWAAERSSFGPDSTGAGGTPLWESTVGTETEGQDPVGILPAMRMNLGIPTFRESACRGRGGRSGPPSARRAARHRAAGRRGRVLRC